MAVIKHIASKNADYGEAERYLIFQHNEYTQKPILDDEGHMILRDEYYLDGLNCDPFSFASECQELNSYYHKNKNFNEIKSHHYIISFDPKDRDECGLTGERAQQLGLTFAKKNFPGHQALVCTHTDGHNESGNIHVHIVINSLRKYDIPKEPYMEFDCESKAGYKHHLSTAYLAHLKQDVMDMCQKEGLHQVDLLSPAERKITEKEYWAQRRGQEKLNKLNQKMLKDGITPKETRYQTEKQFLRDAIDDVASTAKSPEEFAQILDKKYHIIFKISRNRYSYLHPGRKKYITGQYLAHKNVYADYRKSRNKDKFYEEHRAELSLYDTALRTLKEKSGGNKLPSMKALYAEKDRLTELRDTQREDFSNRRDYERELRTVSTNIDMILGKSHEQEQQIEKEQNL